MSSNLFDIIRETPKARSLAQAIRQGYRKYPVEDCLEDVCALVIALLDGHSKTEAFAEHPLGTAVVDKKIAVDLNFKRYGGRHTLADNPRAAESVTVTIDLGSRKPAARV